MQKKLKTATILAFIFVVLVFTVKYFVTTEKDVMHTSNRNTKTEEVQEESSPAEEEQEQDEEQYDETDYLHNPLFEAFNYTLPINEPDPKAAKQNKRYYGGGQEDGIYIESSSRLDSNGLYLALMEAVEFNDVQKAKKFIKRGAKLNSPDGNTSYAPIFWAINNGNVEMVKLLIESGAKVNTPDDQGLFPIHWIVESSASRPLVYQMKDIFDIVLDAHPEEINRQDTAQQQTPMMMAVNLNNKKAFAYLLDKGANVNITDANDKDITGVSVDNACHTCVSILEIKKKQNETTPLINFASTFTAPDPIWLPYSITQKTTKKKQVKKSDEMVIQGDSIAIPTYKDMPDILPLDKKNKRNIVRS